jgi:hypothetical protein
MGLSLGATARKRGVEGDIERLADETSSKLEIVSERTDDRSAPISCGCKRITVGWGHTLKGASRPGGIPKCPTVRRHVFLRSIPS